MDPLEGEEVVGLETGGIFDTESADLEGAAQQPDPHPADLRFDPERLGATGLDGRSDDRVEINEEGDDPSQGERQQRKQGIAQYFQQIPLGSE